jgi:hypothetical protein
MLTPAIMLCAILIFYFLVLISLMELLSLWFILCFQVPKKRFKIKKRGTLTLFDIEVLGNPLKQIS